MVQNMYTYTLCVPYTYIYIIYIHTHTYIPAGNITKINEPNH